MANTEDATGNRFLTVGIGASAGGIQALRQFFEHVPPQSGIAYVVILHLSPDHDSKLAEVLSHSANIPVQQVTEKTLVVPNMVYVVPPNQHLTMQDGFVAVSPNMEVEDRRAPVDIFFRTLADSHSALAVCVILSGTGANGSMGLKRVKEAGGAVFVQRPLEAEFNEMPRNAIATDLVDAILPVAEIPGAILKYKNGQGTVQITIEPEKIPKDEQNALGEILRLLRVGTGNDFSNYKRPTLLRRIERRINILSMPSLAAYARHVQENPAEVTALLKDLLISVTNFFRDKKAFGVLEQDILPAIIKSKSKDGQVRIWVAGCATGEEAYSIAMLCAEQLSSSTEIPKIQIFATDIDEDAIAHAREGVYTLNDAADVSPERLRRFFNKEGDGYRVRREIREMVLFANHNFLKDPPFSHLDLVSCRNVLIYLNRHAQERVMETFHFALDIGGYLFLGTSESADITNSMYDTVNREQHIFKSKKVSRRTYPVPDSVPALRTDPPLAATVAREKANKVADHISYGDLHQRLLEEYAWPSLVVNEEFEVVHISDNAVPYLQFSGGELSPNLLKIVRQELRFELRTALYQALQQKSTVKANGLKVKTGDHVGVINIHVKPVLHEDDVAKGFILVLFEKTEEQATGPEVIVRSDESISRHLEEEVVRLKSQLRNNTEQHEFQAEELKASNEELQAMNEEIRSAAEELETSKEELQSINEELRTVNQELKVKIEETSLTSNNLLNLINSANIGTIFLDRSFRIAMFTPATRDIFNLLPTDVGRPLSDITHRMEYHGLAQDVEKVLEKLTIFENEIKTQDGRVFIMRVLPYRTAEDHINGIVVTFVDITHRKEAEQALQQREEKYRTLFNNIDEGFCLVQVSLDERKQVTRCRITEINPACEQIAGFKKITGAAGTEIIGTVEHGWLDAIHAVITNGSPLRTEHFNAATAKWLNLFVTQTSNQNEVALVFSDITERKLREMNTAFITQVLDDFMRLNNPGELVQAFGQRLGGFMDVSFAFLLEMSQALDSTCVQYLWQKEKNDTLAAPLSPSPLFDGKFAASFPFNETVVINDVEKDPRVKPEAFRSLHIRSIIGVPFYSDGQWQFSFIAGNTTPSTWRPDEIELFTDIAGRFFSRLQRAFAEEALRHREAELARVQQIGGIGVIDIDVSDGFAERRTPEHAAIYGLLEDTRANSYGQWLARLHPDDRLPADGVLKEALESSGNIYENEYRIIRPADGETRWVLARANIERNEQGKATRLVGAHIDVTHRKMLEQQKDDFIVIASHELKTPATSIQVYTELLLEGLEDNRDETNRELAQKLAGQIERLNNLISNLLDTTKITAGKLDFKMGTIDINSLVANSVKLIQHTTTSHRLVFMQGDVPLLQGDSGRLLQVMINLLGNAIKYSPDGGDITVTTAALGKNIRVSVQDKGIGIPQTMLGNIFDRFYRVNNPGIHTYPGMGLGLFISAGIIQQHGGQMGVESKEGDGSTFWFELPANAN